MNFALALVHDTTLEVAAVMRSDAPFSQEGPSLAAADHHVVHLGAFADETPPAGVLWTEWLRKTVSIASDGTFVVAAGGPALLDDACTFEGIKEASRRGRKIHVQVEAWLRTILSEDACDAMGLRRSIPISAIKALERVRVARLGSQSFARTAILERAAQQQSDARTAAQLRARRDPQS